MSDTEPQNRDSGLRRLFGFGRRARADADASGGQGAENALNAIRQKLLAAIGEFLFSHQLGVSSFTLTVACDFLTGSDPRLARAIEARLAAQQPITLEWLEDVVCEAAEPDHDTELNSLMTRLESNLDEFSRATGGAVSAASDYSAALASHVDTLGSKQLVVTELASLARAMLERTRALEQDMERSATQTKALQRSLAEARRAAEEDALTGLPNRRSFETRFASEYDEARAAGEPLCIAFLDIDFFKGVNDTHGHEAGDRVLRSVAGNLARIADAHCHVARHGGEEFVILLRGRSLHQAWEELDELRAAQAERKLINRSTDVAFGQITFSGGIANVFAYPDARAALAAADAALYEAKANGRNRIVVAAPTHDGVNAKAA